MSGISLYPEMNEKIIGILRFEGDNVALYAADLLEQQQAEIKQIAKDRDQWKRAAEASRDVIQPKLRAEIEELKAENERLKADYDLMDDFEQSQCAKLLQEKAERENPKSLITNDDGDIMLCPRCGTDLMGEFTEPDGEKYCPFCGGAVDFYKTVCDRELTKE